MRPTRSLALALLLLPSVAAAQIYVPAPPPPLRVQGGFWLRWGRRHYVPAPPVYVTPPPTYYAPPPPPLPPPPTYYAPPPPPPVYVAPPPACCSVPVATVVQRPIKPQWTSRFGLGATYEGVFGSTPGQNGTETRGMGFLAQLRYRAARHLSLEFQGGYERSSDANGVLRTDAPITFGLLVPFLGPEHALTPYFVVAAGVNFADLHLVDTPDLRLEDTRTQAVGQIGGGLELRLGQHFAINGDLRLEGRWNLGGPSDTVGAAAVKIDGKPESPIANSVAVRLGVGASVYF